MYNRQKPSTECSAILFVSASTHIMTCRLTDKRAAYKDIESLLEDVLWNYELASESVSIESSTGFEQILLKCAD